MWGVELQDPLTGVPSGRLARLVQRAALEQGLILEVGGRDDCVVRLLPPLNIDPDLLAAACALVVELIRRAAHADPPAQLAAAAADDDDVVAQELVG
jgi:diaminobutyrate-2-oxoglutarate transaminase